MNILIYGAGAAGCYLGGQLALGGHQVTLLARGAMGAALASDGLKLRLASGEVHIAPDGAGLRVALSIAQAFADDKFDWLAFTMKSYDTVAAIHELETLVSQPPPILCLQGGVGNEESLAAAFGAERVVAAVLTARAVTVEPGLINEALPGGIALFDGTAAAQPMLHALRRAGLAVQSALNPDALKWSKLLTDQLGNAVATILDMPSDDVFSNGELFTLERAALRETLHVMRAHNIPAINLPGISARTLAWQVQRMPSFLARPIWKACVRKEHGNAMPSLYADLANGRQHSEVIWLNGAVARAGDAIGLPAPVNHVLALTLMDIAQGRASREQFRGRPEMLLATVRIAM